MRVRQRRGFAVWMTLVGLLAVTDCWARSPQLGYVEGSKAVVQARDAQHHGQQIPGEKAFPSTAPVDRPVLPANNRMLEHVQAGSICPNCGRFHPVTSPDIASSRFQQEAEWEAQRMAARGYKSHIRGTIAGVRFCGVGWSSSSSTPPTCTPRGGLKLVADAVARGRDGWYRVRYWR